MSEQSDLLAEVRQFCRDVYRLEADIDVADLAVRALVEHFCGNIVPFRRAATAAMDCMKMGLPTLKAVQIVIDVGPGLAVEVMKLHQSTRPTPRPSP